MENQVVVRNELLGKQRVRKPSDFALTLQTEMKFSAFCPRRKKFAKKVARVSVCTTVRHRWTLEGSRLLILIRQTTNRISMNKAFLFLRRIVSSIAPNSSRRDLCLAVAIVIIGLGFLIFSMAQQTDTTGPDIVNGLDFPSTHDEWARTATPEQIQSADRSALAITNPVLFALLYPVYKDTTQRAKEVEDTYAITHPVEWKALQDFTKSKEQREKEDFWLWAITHPAEYAALVYPLKTAEDLADDEREMDYMRALQPAGPPPGQDRPF